MRERGAWVKVNIGTASSLRVPEQSYLPFRIFQSVHTVGILEILTKLEALLSEATQPLIPLREVILTTMAIRGKCKVIQNHLARIQQRMFSLLMSLWRIRSVQIPTVPAGWATLRFGLLAAGEDPLVKQGMVQDGWSLTDWIRWNPRSGY